MSRETTPISSSTETGRERRHDLPGDPDCPICHGVGYLRVDRPLGHPEFGKAQFCECRRQEINSQVRRRLFSLSRLDELSRMTFDNFLPRGHVGLLPRQADSLERAYSQAQQFARRLEGWLVLHGEFGCGKTHLAAAIANFAVSMGVPTLFITVPDLLDTLRFAYQDPESSFEKRFEEVRSAQLLVLDDFGTQNATPWAQEKLFQIINYRYTNRLPLVVTTNLGERDFEERIRSRLQDPDLVTRVRIFAPDYRNPTSDFGHPEMSSLEMLHNRTFASFDLRSGEGLGPEEQRSLEKALHAAQQFAEKPTGWLVILGPYGTGKTHLAAAIGHATMDRGHETTFVVIPDLLDHLRSTFSPNSTVSLDRRFEQVRTSPLLILDDLGTQATSPWVKEKLYQLFNYRYNAELPTVITSAESMDEMDPRLRSRMLDKRLCQIFGITAPPYTGRADVKVRRSGKRPGR